MRDEFKEIEEIEESEGSGTSRSIKKNWFQSIIYYRYVIIKGKGKKLNYYELSLPIGLKKEYKKENRYNLKKIVFHAPEFIEEINKKKDKQKENKKTNVVENIKNELDLKSKEKENSKTKEEKPKEVLKPRKEFDSKPKEKEISKTNEEKPKEVFKAIKKIDPKPKEKEVLKTKEEKPKELFRPRKDLSPIFGERGKHYESDDVVVKALSIEEILAKAKKNEELTEFEQKRLDKEIEQKVMEENMRDNHLANSGKRM